MKTLPSTSVRIGRVVASLRRARNQLERLLRADNALDDSSRQMLWKEHRELDDHCIAMARRRVAAAREESRA